MVDSCKMCLSMLAIVWIFFSFETCYLNYSSNFFSDFNIVIISTLYNATSIKISTSNTIIVTFTNNMLISLPVPLTFLWNYSYTTFLKLHHCLIIKYLYSYSYNWEVLDPTCFLLPAPWKQWRLVIFLNFASIFFLLN